MSGPGIEPGLRAAFRRRAAADGFLPFDRFMEEAMYAPGVGYYAREASPFGPQGDFYTAPRVHPIFAAALAARWEAVRRALGPDEPFRYVELGPGDGTLAAGVVRALGDRASASGLEVVLCDRALPRRTTSAEAVRSVARSYGVNVRTSGSLAELGPLRGMVVANEVLDAQPARRLRWDGTAWRELGVREGPGGLTEEAGPPGSSVPDPGLPSFGPDDAGRVVELSPSSEALVREVADHLDGGLLVVIDFGGDEPDLWRAHPAGTAAAVRGHRGLASALESPGAADLSTFVDFTRIRAAARAAGWEEIAYRSQAEALGAWGITREVDRLLSGIRSAEEEVRLRLAVKNLLFGFGTFRVLELAAPGSAARLRTLTSAA